MEVLGQFARLFLQFTKYEVKKKLSKLQGPSMQITEDHHCRLLHFDPDGTDSDDGDDEQPRSEEESRTEMHELGLDSETSLLP